MNILVIDIGSSSVRALIYDSRMQLIPDAQLRQRYRMTTSPQGEAIFDALTLRQHVEKCIDQILSHPAAAQIGVVGVATFAGNLLGINSENQPLTPLYTYADTQSAPDIALLREQIDVAQAYQRTGCPHHTAYHPARLHWFQRTQPILFHSVSKWIDFATYLYQAWFGNLTCSYSIASWSGLLNRSTLIWDRAWLDVLNLDESHLPPLTDYNSFQQGLRPEYNARWPLLRHVPFCLAVGDGAAANIGSGCVNANGIALTVGTTAAVRMVLSETLPAVPAGLWNYRVDVDHHLIGGATSEGGNIFDWVRRTFHLKQAEAIDTYLATRLPDTHGLTFLPLLIGERSPGWAGHAKGTIYGLHLETSAEDILQAALEGVALRLSLIAMHFPANIPMIASGGALEASPAWVQILASAMNRTIHLTDEPEITARGTAMLAMRALGKYLSGDFSPRIIQSIQPVPTHVEILQAARERQQALYQQVIRTDWQP